MLVAQMKAQRDRNYGTKTIVFVGQPKRRREKKKEERDGVKGQGSKVQKLSGCEAKSKLISYF